MVTSPTLSSEGSVFIDRLVETARFIFGGASMLNPMIPCNVLLRLAGACGGSIVYVEMVPTCLAFGKTRSSNVGPTGVSTVSGPLPASVDVLEFAGLLSFIFCDRPILEKMEFDNPLGATLWKGSMMSPATGAERVLDRLCVVSACIAIRLASFAAIEVGISD
jgi:hypothetical protein